MMKQYDYYNVYSYRLMRYLESLGFQVIRTKQRDEDPSKTIGKYAYTDEIVEAVKYYVDNKRSVY